MTENTVTVNDSTISNPQKPVEQENAELILASLVAPIYRIQGNYARAENHVDELWYHGYMQGREAELMLKKHGHFLVRRLERDDKRGPIYVVSVFWNGAHYHIRIQQALTGEYFLNQHASTSISNLIWFHVEYRNKPIHAETGLELLWFCRRNSWFIYHEQVNLESNLGKGAFGEVWKGTYRASLMKTRPVAVKTMNEKGAVTDDHRLRFLREAQIMLNLSHPNIANVYGVCIGKDPLMIVMELAEGGSLKTTLIARKKEGKLDAIPEYEDYVYEICAGMAYLESRPVVHRDLAVRNCLLTKSGHVKIADFGLSALCSEFKDTSRQRVPIRYHPPEALITHTYTNKSDVWSFGVVIYEIYSLGRMPYGKLDNKQVKEGVRNGTLRLRPPDIAPDYLKEVMQSTFKLAEDRPTFEEIFDQLKSHRTFKKKLHDMIWPLFE